MRARRKPNAASRRFPIFNERRPKMIDRRAVRTLGMAKGDECGSRRDGVRGQGRDLVRNQVNVAKPARTQRCRSLPASR